MELLNKWAAVSWTLTNSQEKKKKKRWQNDKNKCDYRLRQPEGAGTTTISRSVMLEKTIAKDDKWERETFTEVFSQFD